MSVVAWQANRYVEKNRELQLLQSLDSYASTLESGTTSSQAMGAAISFGLVNKEAKQLASGKLPPDSPSVLSALDSLRSQFSIETAFLVNKQGVIVAYSSNNITQGRGRDLSTQPYVKLAMQGATNVYPSVGNGTNQPGIYLAAPLRSAINSTSKIIGVIVLKVGYGKLNQLLKSWTDGIAILLSPQGVVFASSWRDWVLRTVGKKSSVQIANILRTRQFGNVIDHGPPLPFTFNMHETNIDGVRYVMRGRPLDWNDTGGDWRLLLLDRREPWWDQGSVLSASGLAGLFLAIALFWLFNLVKNAFLLKNMNLKLQARDVVLRERAQLLRDAQSIAGLGTYKFTLSTGLFELSEIAYQLLGIDKMYDHSLSGWGALIHPDDRIMASEKFNEDIAGKGNVLDSEYRIIRPDDQMERWIHAIRKLKLDEQGNPFQVLGTIQDVTERKQAEDEIVSLAFYDPLTGLPNRRLLMDRLQRTLAGCARKKCFGALLFIDLDNFKNLNDTLGHDVGDLLLQQVAKRLISCVREGDTVARMGGDEFVVILQELSLHQHEAVYQVETLAEKILALLNQSYYLANKERQSTPSIGVAMFYDNKSSIDELMKQADIAMYSAKSAGRNAIRFFDPDMQAKVEYLSAIEEWMKKALLQHQFLLYYQAQVGELGKIVGAEVLIRWQHPERGMILPDDFIPISEETGLIVPIGLWVLETACHQLKTWESDPEMECLQLAVNVSARQFKQTDFVDQVVSVLKKTDINPARLKLELTESMVLGDIDKTIVKMYALRRLGIEFAMDDFGTGHSSLASLQKLPLDQLKIDKTFIKDVARNNDGTIIVQTIIAMANNLGMEVIAEGVETQAQKELLLKHGCLHFQGYLFSKPMPVEVFERMLKEKTLQI